MKEKREEERKRGREEERKEEMKWQGIEHKRGKAKRNGIFLCPPSVKPPISLPKWRSRASTRSSFSCFGIRKHPNRFVFLRFGIFGPTMALLRFVRYSFSPPRVRAPRIRHRDRNPKLVNPESLTKSRMSAPCARTPASFRFVRFCESNNGVEDEGAEDEAVAHTLRNGRCLRRRKHARKRREWLFAMAKNGNNGGRRRARNRWGEGSGSTRERRVGE
jgi:hypothetical protein